MLLVQPSARSLSLARTRSGKGACSGAFCPGHIRHLLPQIDSGASIEIIQQDRDGEPAGRRTCETRPLPGPGRSDRQRRWVPRNPGSRPTDRFAGQPERRQPNRRSGRDPEAPDPTPRQDKAGDARPGALSTLSLPNRVPRVRPRDLHGVATLCAPGRCPLSIHSNGAALSRQ